MNVKCIAAIQRLIAELEVHLAPEIAGTGAGDDFRSSVADAAELRAERAVADANFLNLIFRRNASAGESIDDERSVAAGSAASACDLLEVCCKFVFVIGKRVDEIAAENGRAQTG